MSSKIEQVIDEIEEYIEECKFQTFSSTNIIVNKEELEELIAELETIVNKLESNKLSLEDSVNEYKRGIELSIECKKRLDQAKSVVVTKMTETGEKDFK